MTDTHRVSVLLSLRSRLKSTFRELKPPLIIAPSAIIISVVIRLGTNPSPGIMQYVRNIGVGILFALGTICIVGVIKVSGDYFDIRRDLRRLTENIIDEEIARAKIAKKREDKIAAKRAEEASYISLKRELSARGLEHLLKRIK